MNRPDLPRHGKPWTDEEEDRLRELYPDVDTTELVEDFGRSYEAIKRRAQRLGISKADDYQNPIESDGFSQQGADTEERFEEHVDEQGWLCYRNTEFREFNSWKQGYEHLLEDLPRLKDEDWYTAGMRERDEQKKNELETRLDKPDWFTDLRESVNVVLEEWDHGWTRYPDYVVGDCPEGPWFVEVKYGSSNLMKSQIQFFEFLQSNGFAVKIFRVAPTGREQLYEWAGGWK